MKLKVTKIKMLAVVEHDKCIERRNMQSIMQTITIASDCFDLLSFTNEIIMFRSKLFVCLFIFMDRQH